MLSSESHLHAAGSVAQASVRPHLDGSVALLLRQLQHTRVVGHGLVKVPLGVVGAAQVAVGSGLLAPVPQILRKGSRIVKPTGGQAKWEESDGTETELKTCKRCD